MFTKKRWARWMKLRFAVLYPFGIWVLFTAYADNLSILVGAIFIACGLLIRVWANGYAIKMDKLTTSGPYAFVRNPLYLGTFLIASGFVLLLRIYIPGIVFLAILLSIYYLTVQKEEDMLADKFKATYLDYKKKVPAIFPKPLPYKPGEKWLFSFKRLLESKEHKVVIWIIIAVIIFHLKYRLLIKQEGLNLGTILLICAGFLLAALDLSLEFEKKIKTS